MVVCDDGGKVCCSGVKSRLTGDHAYAAYALREGQYR